MLLISFFGMLGACDRQPSLSLTPEGTLGITDQEIKIGSSAALSGPAAFLGTQLTQGSQAWIEEVNRHGGIHGRQVKLICYDDRYTPELTAAHAGTLLNLDRVFMLMDFVGTPTAQSIIRLANEKKVPVLGLFTGAEFLRNPFQPYVINVRASYFMEAEAMVDFWFAHGRSRVAVFMQDDAFGSTVLAGTSLALARHQSQPVATALFTRGAMPKAEEVEKIIQARPDAVVMVGTSKALAQFVKMAKEGGLAGAHFHTVSFVGSEEFARDLLAFQNGIEQNVFVTQVMPSPFDRSRPVVREFTEIYKKYYPHEMPNYVALEGFVNAKILTAALEKAGRDLSRPKLIQTLEAMGDFDAGTGLPPVIAPENHSFFEDVFITSLQNGEFKAVQ